MIHDIMTRLDGTPSDELRVSAVDQLAENFQSHIIGLYLNVIPYALPEVGGNSDSAELRARARELGDRVEAQLSERLKRLQKPTELRRFDCFPSTIGDIAAREARAADVFVAIRPNGIPRETGPLVEGVLFGSGRHVLLVPDAEFVHLDFKHVMIAWNGSRESARALIEALPYLEKAERVTVVVVADNPDTEHETLLGADAARHLDHHGIKCELRHVPTRNGDIAATLLDEATKDDAGLLVMGGYGHSRLREWLLGGTTYKILHRSRVPLLMAH